MLFLYFNIPLLLVLTFRVDYNDIWFLLNHGKYVLNNGFPLIEPFTIHENFAFVMQQWLSSVIFYLSYSALGKYGLLILTLLVTGYIIFISYKLCMLLSEKRHTLSVILTTIMTTLLAYYFITVRPQIFTFAILITEIYLLEKYIKESVGSNDQVFNFGIYQDSSASLSYVQVSLAVALLINSKATDFIVTGCTSGQGMMLA